ncbi:MAG: trigger factor [Ignavibacteria bacterium]|nr:trigger factor [Bacteroidota bacterium]MSQ45722.1 trigger factor [Ignavibacteria bacterium]
MEIKHQTLTGCDQQIDITLTQEDLAPHFESAYKKAAKTIKIDGFRQGKVPIAMVKKLYASSIQHDALQEIADESFRNALIEKNIIPIGTPEMTDMQFKPGTPFSFIIKYEVRPSIELKQYKQLKIEKPIFTTSEKDVTEEASRLQRIHATYSPAEKVDGKEFVVTANIKEFDESENEILDRNREGVKIYLNEPSTEEEIKTSLEHAELNGSYSAKFNHKHAEHEHKIHLQFNVTGIENIILPTFDDEFVKKVTKDKMLTVEEFNSNVKKDLENYYSEQSRNKFLDNLTQEIIKNHDFPVPESLVKSLQDSFVDEYKQQHGKKLPVDFDETEYRESLKPSATWQGKWFLLREEILKQENLTLTDEDIERHVTAESEKLGIDKNTLQNFYKTSDKYREKILTDKLFDFLQKETIIVEKPIS